MNTSNLTRVHRDLFDENSRLKFVKSYDDISLVLESPSSTGPSIGWLFFHKENKSVNVLDKSLQQKAIKLFEHANRLANEGKIKALVLYSLNKGFIVGADVNMIYPIVNTKEAEQLALDGHQLLFKIENLPIPTIAAIHGNCLGGGLEVALSCSHRVASDDKSTSIGLPEVKLGLLPGAGGCVRLPRLIGLRPALQLILTGASVSAKKAKRLGILDNVFSFERGERSFFERVRLYAFQLSQLESSQITEKYSRRSTSMKELLLEGNPIGRSILEYQTNNYLNSLTKGRYPAPYVALDTVVRAYSAGSIEDAMQIEAKNFGKLVCTKQAKNLISLFLMIEGTKRIENFCNPSKLIPVEKIGVIGSGIMGSGIAQIALFKHYEVHMKDIEDAFLQDGFKKINSLFDSLVTRGKITDEEKDYCLSHLTGSTNYTQLSDAQVVIEAAVEREDIKQDILRNIEELNPNVIYATNTSSIPVTRISAIAKKKENVLGMHFFNPVHKMPLVEIVRTKYTSDLAVGTVYQLALGLGKIPIVVNDGPGFLTTRLFAVYCLEASRIALEGCSFDQVDSALHEWGLPMGPFSVMDESGLDIGLSVFSVLAKKLGLGFEQYNALHDLVKGENSFGKKVGKGFYLYDNGKRVGVNPAAIRIFYKYRAGSPKQYEALKNTQYVRENSKDIVDRCILVLLNEATRCMEERIVFTPEDVDLAMILGIGFPPFRGGGLLGYADHRGLGTITKRLQELSKLYGDRFRPTQTLLRMAKNGQKFFPERIIMTNLASKM